MKKIKSKIANGFGKVHATDKLQEFPEEIQQDIGAWQHIQEVQTPLIQDDGFVLDKHNGSIILMDNSEAAATQVQAVFGKHKKDLSSEKFVNELETLSNYRLKLLKSRLVDRGILLDDPDGWSVGGSNDRKTFSGNKIFWSFPIK